MYSQIEARDSIEQLNVSDQAFFLRPSFYLVCIYIALQWPFFINEASIQDRLLIVQHCFKFKPVGFSFSFFFFFLRWEVMRLRVYKI